MAYTCSGKEIPIKANLTQVINVKDKTTVLINRIVKLISLNNIRNENLKHFDTIWKFDIFMLQVFDGLKNYSPHVTVYHKAEIYDRWYLKKHGLVPPIIADASAGWYIEHVSHNSDSCILQEKKHRHTLYNFSELY